MRAVATYSVTYGNLFLFAKLMKLVSWTYCILYTTYAAKFAAVRDASDQLESGWNEQRNVTMHYWSVHGSEYRRMAPCITAAHYVILTSFEHLLTAHSAHRSHHNTPLHHHLILILLLLHDDDDVDTLMSRPSRSLISLGPAGEAYSAPPLLAGIFRGREKRKGRGE